jgi:UDP-N-acetyl-L-fucosamine synthase
VDSGTRLSALVDTLDKLSSEFSLPTLISTHPRTRKRLEALGRKLPRNLRFHKPFGFLDYNALQMHASCVLSDSGSITEESAILGFPAVTVRQAMERPEGLDTGSIVLTGLDPEVIAASVRLAVEDHSHGRLPPCPADYQIANCSQRVVRLILGTAKLSHQWAGVSLHDYN